MGLPSLKITCEGRPLPDHMQVLDLEVELAINRVPQATLTLLDGSLPERRFAISNQQLLAPGSRVTIALGYVSKGALAKKVFDGIVTRHAVSATGEGCRLRVQLSDRAIQLTRGRRSAIYSQTNDGEVMRKLIQAAGLRVGRIAPTPITHPELVQFNVSDWDFLVSRADVLGLAIRVSQGSISALPLALGTPARVLNHGLDDTRELELELDGTQQWASLSVSGWDGGTLQRSQAVRAKGKPMQIGNQSAQALAKAVEAPAATLFHGAPTAPQELQSWADARLGKLRWSLLRGTVTVNGNASLKPLDTVEITGVGERFNGRALVSGVTHTFNIQGWNTHLRLGVSAECYARSPDLQEMPAAGLLPAASGLQIATVQSLRVDPKGELRVRVGLPHTGEAAGELWARLLTPDAGAKRGFVFRPEVGDEVVLGFLNDDPRQPLILGAMFSGKNKPPKPVQEPDKANNLRAIVSRAGTRIVFDDGAPSLALETSDSGDADGSYKNRICINAKQKTITIEDQHDNKILLSDQGIALSSGKDIRLNAKGEVTIKGEKAVLVDGNKTTLKAQQLEAKGSAKVSVKGAQMELSADASLDLKGGAKTTVAADALVEIKGALVKIN
ncbi:MAG: type VI secretion system tip protein VgrG [Cyanobacteriota bacterium]|nr:type VI secretion system tip protein VgrG [Cyanobacteriota bacterium]